MMRTLQSNRAVAADALEAALLQDPQELHLHLQRHIADLVQEQRAALGKFETADARAQGPGERAFLMTEQLALQQVRRDGAAIDRHEGVAGAARQLMHMARDHLLAGAGLAQDEHVGVERRHLLDEPVNGPHRTGSAARPEAVRPGLRRVAVAHVLRLVEHRRQAPLLHRELQMQPRKVATALGNLRQAVAREVNDRQRLRQRAQARDELGTFPRDGLGADDQRQPVVGAFGLAAELC